MADLEIDLEITNPQELVGLGVRAFAIGDYANAAAAFGRATELMASEHGEKHDSLGEVFLQYARSLLEVSREEGEPLGDAIPHGETDSDSEEEEVEGENGKDNKDEPSETKEESNEAEAKENKEVKQNGNVEPEKVEESKEEEKDSEETETNGDVEVTPGTSQDDGDKKEDCTDLQLAWEVLEVAKIIFTNRGDPGKERLSETLILLGEVAMESENFTDGINDMKAGLEIQKSLFEPTSRKLAETYYKIGIAQSTITNIEEAVESFENSINILKKRIKHLEEQVNEKKTEDSKKLSDEIEEIKKLIPEIEEKINDTKSIKEEVAAKLMEEMAKPESSSKEEKPAPSASKANDISHLVKRKRKADEEAPEAKAAQPAKRPTP